MASLVHDTGFEDAYMEQICLDQDFTTAEHSEVLLSCGSTWHLPGPVLTQLGACVRGLMKLKARHSCIREQEGRQIEDNFYETCRSFSHLSQSLSALPKIFKRIPSLGRA